jgi:predicted permease
VGPIARAALFPGVDWGTGPVTSRVVAVALGASLVLGGVIAAITALQAGGVDPAALLASGGSRITGGRRSRRVRLGLVGVQAALSVSLIAASTAFVRSFRSATQADIGFDINGLIQATVPMPEGSDDIDRQWAFYRRLHERIGAMPGVESASLGYMSPWWNNRNESVAIPGRDSLPRVPNFGEPAFDIVTPEYLTTLRLKLRFGRWFSNSDRDGSAPVMVVNDALARLYWPGEPNVLGRCIRVGEQSTVCREIVGVVGSHSFTGGLGDAPLPAYFLPMTQAREYGAPVKLFVRARGDAAALLPAIRRAVQTFESGLPAGDVHLVRAQRDPLLASWRLGALAFTALGVVSAVIAMIGLFSVLAYLVAERRREFAIRGALGARASQIVRPVVWQGTLVVSAGAVVGGAIIWRAAKWIQPMLFEVRLLDPLVLGGVLGAVLAMAVLSALGPARNASRMDPMEALRAD